MAPPCVDECNQDRQSDDRDYACRRQSDRIGRDERTGNGEKQADREPEPEGAREIAACDKMVRQHGRSSWPVQGSPASGALRCAPLDTPVILILRCAKILSAARDERCGDHRLAEGGGRGEHAGVVRL